jgi:hypothetical protein
VKLSVQTVIENYTQVLFHFSNGAYKWHKPQIGASSWERLDKLSVNSVNERIPSQACQEWCEGVETRDETRTVDNSPRARSTHNG